MPDARALKTHMVAEDKRLASGSVWDGAVIASGYDVGRVEKNLYRITDGA